MWNEDVGVHGAWDADACTTVITEQTEVGTFILCLGSNGWNISVIDKKKDNIFIAINE